MPKQVGTAREGVRIKIIVPIISYLTRNSECLNEEGQTVHGYIVHRCWVSEFQALPDLDAGANAIALEHIKLENEGWEIDPSKNTEQLET